MGNATKESELAKFLAERSGENFQRRVHWSQSNMFDLPN